MEALSKIKTIADSAGVLAGILLAKAAQDYLTSRGILSFYNFVAFVFIIFTSKFFITFIFDQTVISNKWLRKIILQDEFIEGTWLERVDNCDLGVIATVSKISFSFKDSKFNFSGTNYSDRGKFHSNFRADMVAVQGNTMLYKTTRDFQGIAQEGFGRMRFTSWGSGPPNEFTGFFDLGDGKGRHNVVAKKVVAKNELSSLDDPLERAKIIDLFLLNYQ